MADLPSGTVTFLFTDIEGSTQLWERDRTAMAAAVERHFQLRAPRSRLMEACCSRPSGMRARQPSRQPRPPLPRHSLANAHWG
ncbi:MAG TPA: hypothetical protein VK356_08975, partial [Thermomicrobiales bacterium]|nr:hypothetical protein [Thermomicrobiales bacterium]